MKILMIIFAALLFNASIFAADVKGEYFYGIAPEVEGQPILNPPADSKNFMLLPKVKGFLFPRDSSFPLKHLGLQYLPRNVDENHHGYITFMANMMSSFYYLDLYGPEQAEIRSENTDIKSDDIAGNGFENNDKEIIEFFKKENIPYQNPGQTIIEGGNIHFVERDGKTMALMGENSLFLTFAAMEIDNLWPIEKIAQIAATVADADISLYNTAKKVHKILHAIYKHTIFGGDVTSILVNDMSENFEAEMKGMLASEKPLYKEMARLLMAKLQWCKQKIVDELGLAGLDCLIILPQRAYHLDLDSAVTPLGAVILRAPEPENEYEEIIFARQKQILEEHLPGEVIEAEESDPGLICGLSIPGGDIFLHMQAEDEASGVRFQQFLFKKCGYRAARAICDRKCYEEQDAGPHCKAQEYMRSPPSH